MPTFSARSPTLESPKSPETLGLTGRNHARVPANCGTPARVEDHIRNDKDTGLRNLPFHDFNHNQVWLALVRIAHDLITWTQRLLLTGDLAKAEPKRLRYRLLHVAARLAFHARTATLRIQGSWPWARELAAAFQRLQALPG